MGSPAFSGAEKDSLCKVYLNLKYDKEGNSLGYAFVTFETLAEVDWVIKGFMDHRIHGKWIEVFRFGQGKKTKQGTDRILGDCDAPPEWMDWVLTTEVGIRTLMSQAE